MNPHLFRDAAATSIAIEDPSHVGSTKSVLGHSSLRTSERHYNQARSTEATAAYQSRVTTLRRSVVTEVSNALATEARAHEHT